MKYTCLPVVCCFSASIPVYREDYNSRKNCETVKLTTNVSDVPRRFKLSFNHLIGRTHS